MVPQHAPVHQTYVSYIAKLLCFLQLAVTPKMLKHSLGLITNLGLFPEGSLMVIIFHHFELSKSVSPPKKLSFLNVDPY